MIYDITERKFVDEMPIGSMGQVSFRRLVDEVFRYADEIKPNETVSHIKIVGDMIQYRIGD